MTDRLSRTTSFGQGCVGQGPSRGGRECKLPLMEELMFFQALGLASADGGASQTFGLGST